MANYVRGVVVGGAMALTTWFTVGANAQTATQPAKSAIAAAIGGDVTAFGNNSATTVGLSASARGPNTFGGVAVGNISNLGDNNAVAVGLKAAAANFAGRNGNAIATGTAGGITITGSGDTASVLEKAKAISVWGTLVTSATTQFDDVTLGGASNPAFNSGLSAGASAVAGGTRPAFTAGQGSWGSAPTPSGQ